jgi:hypothetical protein
MGQMILIETTRQIKCSKCGADIDGTCTDLYITVAPCKCTEKLISDANIKGFKEGINEFCKIKEKANG